MMDILDEEDIATTGRCWMGLRHVSTRERGEKEQRNGFSGGSLNPSFRRALGDVVNFVDLLPDDDPEKRSVAASRTNPLSRTCRTEPNAHRRTTSEGVDRGELVALCEAAVRNFIVQSAEIDLAQSAPPTVNGVKHSLEETTFLLAECVEPCVPPIGDAGVLDCERLGKFENTSVPPGNIALPPSVGAEESHNALEIFAHCVMQRIVNKLSSGWHGTADPDEIGRLLGRR